MVAREGKLGASDHRPPVGVGACPRGCKADSEKVMEKQEGGATLKACRLRGLEPSRVMLG